MGPARVLPLHQFRPTSQLTRIAQSCRSLLQKSARLLRHDYGNGATVYFLRLMVVLLADLVREAAEYDRRHPHGKRPADDDCVHALLEEFYALLRQMEDDR